jgi:serine/arginine repetitive matrix protein 1
MAAAKATRAKTLATRKEIEEEGNRRSVAYYPTPADGDELVDAIPSWTQLVPREGNWDDVSRLAF